MPEKTIVFKKEKKTKNTIRYKEIVPDKEKSIIGTLYVKQSYLENCEETDQISIIIITK